MTTKKKIIIRNVFDQKITKSQQKWLDQMIEKTGMTNILDISLTRGGYLSVDYRRKSTSYPYGREIRGVRGGWVESLLGKDYDFENLYILNGVANDSTFGSKLFGLA